MAGNGQQGYNGDNMNALTTSFMLPQDVYISKDDQFIYIGGMSLFLIEFCYTKLICLDTGQLRVRSINIPTQIIDTYVGNGHTFSSGDGIRAIDATYGQYIFPFINTKSAKINNHQDIYIGDVQGGLLRKIYYSIGDRQLYTKFIDFIGGSLMVNVPRGLFVDDSGNIYYAVVFYNNVYKMDVTTGQQLLFAGISRLGNSGNGGPATSAMLNRPVQVFGDYSTWIYIVESGSSKIRKVDLQSGIISDFCGTSIGYGGDNGLPEYAKLANPAGGFYHRSTGDIYIAGKLLNFSKFRI